MQYNNFNHPKKRSRLKVFAYLVILVGMIAFTIFGYFNFLKSAPNSRDTSLSAFVISRGEGTSQIAERLEEKGFIRSALVFKILTKLNNTRIEAGDYKLSPSMDINEVMKQFSKGSVDKWVTIIEGLRVEQIADKLSKEIGTDKKDFLKNAKEGYMFPDTYLFNPESSGADIASIMRNTFESKTNDEMLEKVAKKGLSKEEWVILASLVEREGRSEKVRTEVAGVILRRLGIGMKLDIDATVQYARDSELRKSDPNFTKFWQPITQKEYTSIVSPYNTYLNPGLPMGPICNPSLASLKAVANANQNSPYLYYFHDLKGNSYYAETLDEHNENVARYR